VSIHNFLALEMSFFPLSTPSTFITLLFASLHILFQFQWTFQPVKRFLKDIRAHFESQRPKTTHPLHPTPFTIPNSERTEKFLPPISNSQRLIILVDFFWLIAVFPHFLCDYYAFYPLLILYPLDFDNYRL